MEWWTGDVPDDAPEPCDAYYAHLAAIRDRLPPDLLIPYYTVSLHDAKVREINYDAETGVLLIRMNGYSREGESRRIELCYGGVRSIRSTADPKVGLGGPHGYGDLGYHEVDIDDDGLVEHRILFSTGIELVIRFRDFSIDWRDT